MENLTKEKIKQLRKTGKTYSEINQLLKLKIPKSTLSYICKNVQLPKNYYAKVQSINHKSLNLARQKATEIKNKKQKELADNFYKQNRGLKKYLSNKNNSKILLACLYLAEGSKTPKGSLTFGNSDPKIIKFFLFLLRNGYLINEDKFRCTLQCRADQNIISLQKFWSNITNIPLNKFYKPQIDKRSLGKRTLKTEYKGVCRLDYFSAKIFHELTMIGEIITK